MHPADGVRLVPVDRVYVHGHHYKGMKRGIRIQQREDGVRIDQIVISAHAHFDGASGASKADATIVPVFGAGASGSGVGHVYRGPETYPVTLTVAAGSAGAATDGTVGSDQVTAGRDSNILGMVNCEL